MADNFQVVTFGDLSTPYFAELQKLVFHKTDFVLTSLFDDTYRALRAELSRLPPSQKASLPQSSNLLELLAGSDASSTRNCALTGALACLYQIASLVSYIGKTKVSYPQNSTCCISGGCFGLLASVAVSCSETVVDLVSITPDTVALAFRLGLLVQARTDSVVPSSSDGSSSYSYVLPGADETLVARLVDEYCQLRDLSTLSRVYISALSVGSITVSGPPAELKEFMSLHPELKSAKLQINGLFHSSWLYTPQDVAELVATFDAGLKSRTSHLDIMPNSVENKEQYSRGVTCESLLRVAISDILLHRLRWDLVVKGTVTAVQRSASASAVDVLPFAAGSVEGMASSIRASAGVDRVQIQDTLPAPPPEEDARKDKRATRSKIAIIGFSGRFPEADDNKEFWELLAAGLDVHKEIPKDRFDPWLYYDAAGKKKNTSCVTKGCFVRNPDLFDSRFFSMSPREADQADPAQRLVLMTAYEAMEMAGFVPDSSPSTQRSRVGVFYGTASDDYREINAAQNVDTYFVPGGSRAFLPGRVNYHFRFSGPSFDVDTACSSGLAAVHIACNSLWSQDCDVAVAGGTNILTNPDNWCGLDRAHFLSRTGNCNTFDDAADGYCRSDSVATVLLKRLDDALLDGDPIFGTILGAYTNHSAEAVSMTRPHSGAQRAIFSRILNAASVDGSDVSYVEMHGTGTQHGDACEMDSVLSVFAPQGSGARDKALFLGSAKANIGHAESASGVASLIKVLLMMQNHAIPPHVGIKTKINRNFPTDLAQRNVHIAMKTTPWPRPDPRDRPHGRRAFVNNFGAAGGNSSVLIEDGPVPILPETGDGDHVDGCWATHVVAVSAKTQASFKNNLAALVGHLDAHPDVSLDSLSYTTTARRAHYAFRTAVAGTSVDEIKRALQSVADREKHLSVAGGGPPIGFCFTGQGSQYLGMGKRLFSLPRFREFMVGLDETAGRQGFPSFLDVIQGRGETPVEQMAPVKVQLAITCLQMALGKLLIALGVTPRLVVGHSLGEYAAMNVAGVIGDADTIHLVGSRARLLEKHCAVGTHAMLAIKASAVKVASLKAASHPDLDIACVNGPEETVVAGSNEQIESFKAALSSQSIKSTTVKVQFAFHSAQVEPLLDEFRRICSSVTLRDPSFPILSPMMAKVINKAADMGSTSDYLARHCRESVRFHDCLSWARQSSLLPDRTTWVEIGPHPLCSNMLRSVLGSSTKTLPCLRRGEDDWAVFLPTLMSLYDSGLPVDWIEYHHGGGSKKRKQVIQLPAYQWDLKSHWIPYEHDWCLTKGDAPTVPLQAPTPSPSRAEAKFSTTSVQDVVYERYAADESCITARSDVQHPDFREVLLAHKVNGRPLCTSSVYADMAMTLFARLLDKSPIAFDKTDIGIEVANMAVDKSLILDESSNTALTQLLEMKAHVKWSTRQATFSLSSIASDGKATEHHAKCTGSFTEKSRWRAEWKRHDFLIKARVQHLRQSAHSDDDDGGETAAAHLIKTGLFYKLFSALVDYEAPFKGCRELVMRSADMESTAKVKFNTPPGTSDKWMNPPYWIDSLGQITGFTMNGNDQVDSKTQVYINHGWDNMKLSERLSDQKTYTTYVKMQPRDKGSYSGDVYVFGPGMDEVVAVYEGVTFAAVPRKVLDRVLPKKGQATGEATATRSTTSSREAKTAPESAPAGYNIPTSETQPLPQLVVPEKQGVAAEKLKLIIAEEVGASLSDIEDDAELAALGVDSLLALTMSDRMLEELKLKVDSTCFITCTTVAELLEAIVGPPSPSSGSGSVADTPLKTPDAEPEYGTFGALQSLDAAAMALDSNGLPSLGGGIDDGQAEPMLLNPAAAAAMTKQPPQTVAVPPASSVLLQGDPTTCTRKMWLFPDGSGIAASYMPLPDLDAKRVAVFGLNSPYVKRTDSIVPCQFHELTAVYLAEIRRRQPAGPYVFGGWSAGGISAYEAAQELAAAGETIDGLILLDTPKPIDLKELPSRLYGQLDGLNVFGIGNSRPPPWLLTHFALFSAILDTFKPRPWRAATPLRAWAIWAQHGVDEAGSIAISPDDPDNVAWLLKRRVQESLVANGWDQLVGSDNVTPFIVEGAHHFNMLKQPAVKQVCDYMQRIMKSLD
uniref:AshP n=1 Tax=Aschersonia paraphysata TaxID=370937 RepID=A0A514YR67_9HYPO|nr:AshP [Aschersonia paraphysata]